MNSSERLKLHLSLCCRGWLSEYVINLFMENLKGNKITRLLLIEYLKDTEQTPSTYFGTQQYAREPHCLKGELFKCLFLELNVKDKASSDKT